MSRLHATTFLAEQQGRRIEQSPDDGSYRVANPDGDPLAFDPDHPGRYGLDRDKVNQYLTRRIEAESVGLHNEEMPPLGECDVPVIRFREDPDRGLGWTLYLADYDGEVIAPVHFRGQLDDVEQARRQAEGWMYSDGRWTVS